VFSHQGKHVGAIKTHLATLGRGGGLDRGGGLHRGGGCLGY
jgi:hypothetical protein